MRRNSLVAYISTVHALVHTVEWTYAALLSRIGDEFGPGLFGLGAVATVFAITFGSSALPAGVLADRLGTQRVLSIAFAGAAVAALLVATAPNVVVLALFLAVLGLAVGLYHPAGISLIAQAAEQRGSALGYHGLAGNLGIAVAPALAIGVAEATGSWRWSYVLLALLALLAALSLRLVKLPRAETAAGAALGSVEPAFEGASAQGARDEGRGPGSAPARSLLPLLLVYGVFVLNGFIYRGSLTFLPVHFERSLDVSWFSIDSDNLKTALTTAALLIGAFGQVLGGWLSQRHKLERLAPLLTLALIPFLLLMGLTTNIALVVAAAGFVFFNFSSQPVYTGLIADYSPQRALGRSYGVSFFAAFGIGALGATAAGFFADRWGTDAVYQSLAGFALITLALAIYIWRLASRPAATPAPDEPLWPARPRAADRRS